MGDEDPSVNENIEIQNGLLRDALKKEIPGSRFIDVFDLFLDDDFEIREDLFKDGLHPNDEGYEILSRQIQRAL
jgi:lysophospholipase L1-like esterase